MDDIFCLFNSESNADKYLFFLNQQHSTIKFTIEKQAHNQLSFLDLFFINNGDNFLTPVYRKSNPVVYTLSFTSFSYKIGLIKTFLHRLSVCYQ